MSISRQAAIVLLGTLVVALQACQRPVLAPTDYMRWVQDPVHGLVQDRVFPKLALRLQYRPNEQVILARHGPGITRQELDQESREQQGCYQFNLQLRSLQGGDALAADASNEDDYYHRLFYFTSEVENDLSLIVGGDTLPCALAHFERTYGAAPFNDLVVSFVDQSGGTASSDITFLYNDRAYGLGPVSFTIKRGDLRKIPAIKLS